jgi:hypothetical protein
VHGTSYRVNRYPFDDTFFDKGKAHVMNISRPLKLLAVALMMVSLSGCIFVRDHHHGGGYYHH